MIASGFPIAVSIIGEDYVKTNICDMITGEITDSVKADVATDLISDANAVGSMVNDQIDQLDGNPRSTVYVAANIKTRRGQILPSKTFDAGWSTTLEKILRPKICMVKPQDYMMAESVWEWCGSILPSNRFKKIWSKESRLVLVSLRKNDRSLVMVDSGNIIDGIDLDIEATDGSIDDVIDYIQTKMSADLTLIAPFEGEDLHGHMTVPSVGPYKTPDDWVTAGCVLEAQKDLFGDMPSFLRVDSSDNIETMLEREISIDDGLVEL